MQSAYITVEFGHKTVKRKEPTSEGYDHDWEVYVRSYDDKVQLNEIVQRVVFEIHESYAKPRRG